MKCLLFHKRNRQKGLALILAIGFLAILSILGAVVMDVATNDLKRSATDLPQRQAFYVADRAVEYAMNRDIVFTLMSGDTVNIASGSHKTIIEKDGVGTLESGSIKMLASEELSMPDHLAELHGNDFGVVLYHVNAKASAALGAEANIDASIVRLFKKDDDQIFRTSGGG